VLFGVGFFLAQKAIMPLRRVYWRHSQKPFAQYGKKILEIPKEYWPGDSPD
jgi:hypothetical protein